MANPYVSSMPNPTLKPGSLLDDPKWVQEYMLEWLGTFRFNKLIGEGDKPIHYVSQLVKSGEFVKVPLLGALRKRGVTGNMPLEGREEIADQHVYNARIDHWRNGVAVTEWDERRQVVELKPQIRTLLMNWSKVQLRDQIIDALFSTGFYNPMHTPLRNPDPTQVIAGDPAIVNVQTQATAAQLNTWILDNADRVVLGKNTANPTGTFAAEIGALAATDTAGAAMLQIMKDKADTAHKTGYGIEPLSVGGDDETGYVVLCGTKVFNQFRADPDIKDFNKSLVSGSGKESGQQNPYFVSGDLLWDNIILKRVAEIDEHNATTGRMVMLGKQAVALCLGDDTQIREQTRDYGHLHGIGIRESLSVGKMQRELTSGKKVDYGTVTAFCRI